jgi:hypothetical protein
MLKPTEQSVFVANNLAEFQSYRAIEADRFFSYCGKALYILFLNH